MDWNDFMAIVMLLWAGYLVYKFVRWSRRTVRECGWIVWLAALAFMAFFWAVLVPRSWSFLDGHDLVANVFGDGGYFWTSVGATIVAVVSVFWGFFLLMPSSMYTAWIKWGESPDDGKRVWRTLFRGISFIDGSVNRAFFPRYY